MSRSWIHRGLGALAASVTLAASVAIAAPATASATQPTMFAFEVDLTVYAPGTSAVCGFDVFVTTQGTAHVRLFVSQDGSSVVREIDWNTGWTQTFSAPALGTSYTQRTAGPLITTYPEGTDVGDPATAVVVGSNGRIGDDPGEAGRTVFDAVVVFVDPATGIPGIDFVGVQSSVGHFLGGNAVRRCEVLAS